MTTEQKYLMMKRRVNELRYEQDGLGNSEEDANRMDEIDAMLTEAYAAMGFLEEENPSLLEL